MGQITDFFRAPQTPIQPVPQIQAVGEIQNPEVVNNGGFPNNQVQQQVCPN